MSKNSRIYPSFNPSGGGHRGASFPDCHWELCRQFMDRYQSVLPAEQVYALAHIFANTQLLLRGDADQTMMLVLDLVRDRLPEGGATTTTEVDHVENRGCRWEREAEPEVLESMEALDISGDEVVVKREPEEMEEESVPEEGEPCPSAGVKVVEESKVESCPDVEMEEPEEVVEEFIPEVVEESVSEALVGEPVSEEREPDCPSSETMNAEFNKVETNPDVEMNQTQPSEERKNIVPEPTPEVPTKFIRVVPPIAPIPMETVYKNLILFDDNFEKTRSYFNRLNCGKLEMTFRQYADLQYSATVKIDHQVLAQASGKKRPHALTRASQLFSANMQDHCYRIETLPFKKFLQLKPNIIQREATQTSTSPEPINESNVGFRLLQKIGWTGGPLGASAQGRLDPVECSAVRKDRAGIGAVVPPPFDVPHFRKVMKDFQRSDDGCHLVFSEEFTSEERSELNRIASQLRLECRVFTLPKGVKHFVVMARELPPLEIIRRILIDKHAGLSAQYRVVAPKKSVNFLHADALSKAVPHSPKVPELKKDSVNNEESDNDSQPSSDEENSPNPTNTKLKVQLSTLEPETHSQILSSLTQFKPVRSLRTIEDVFHNIVIIGNKFRKTAKEFKMLGSGLLELRVIRLPEGDFCTRISVGEFVLAEVCDPKQSKASKGAQAAFLKKAAMFAYRLTPTTSKKNMENAIARKISPKTNMEFYKSLIQDFSKDSLERELVFSAEFHPEERLILQRTAHSLKLRAVTYGSRNNRHLRIIGQALPALAILERILVQKDPMLSKRYDVTPPRIGPRRDGSS